MMELLDYLKKSVAKINKKYKYYCGQRNENVESSNLDHIINNSLNSLTGFIDL